MRRARIRAAACPRPFAAWSDCASAPDNRATARRPPRGAPRAAGSGWRTRRCRWTACSEPGRRRTTRASDVEASRQPPWRRTHVAVHSGMKFLLLVYIDPELTGALPAQQYDAEMRSCLEHADELHTEGKLIESQQLEPVSTAKSVRIRNGRQTVFDGP